VISFRQHLVTLIAVFLALATGVVLGGGPLSELGRTAGDRATDSSAATRQDDAESAVSGFADAYAQATATQALAAGLKGETVVLVTMPGADPDVVTQLGTLVSSAGGKLVGRFDAQQSLIDPGQKSLVDTLGSQLVTSLKDSSVATDATTYVRMGELLALGIATKTPAGAAVDANGTAVLGGLKGAKLVTSEQAGTRRAALVLVVMGEEPADLGAGGDVIVSGLLTGLARGSQGVVVAGSTASATDGLLAQLRDDPTTTDAVSSTDSVQTGAGQVTAILALAAAKEGRIGAFGASGADGAVPVG
jgi:hypothetical protein